MKNKLLQYISYFDVFNHPLKKEELSKLCATDDIHIEPLLNALVLDVVCYEKNGYYSLNENVSKLIDQRTAKEKKAKKYFNKLPFFARIIKSFPFVSGIAVSGSLSKNVMHDDGDIDYFIITSPGRLWICRTLLVLFKKVFLLNSKKYFCVNYFVDEENMEILDKNIFTAIEISYLMPVYNHQLIQLFKKENDWKKEYLLNFEQPIQLAEIKGNGLMRRCIQFLLKGKLGDRIDLFLMKFTYKKWEKKFKHFDTTKFNLTMRSNRGVSKHHPRDFQNKVLTEYNNRLNKLKIER